MNPAEEEQQQIEANRLIDEICNFVAFIDNATSSEYDNAYLNDNMERSIVACRTVLASMSIDEARLRFLEPLSAALVEVLSQRNVNPLIPGRRVALRMCADLAIHFELYSLIQLCADYARMDTFARYHRDLHTLLCRASFMLPDGGGAAHAESELYREHVFVDAFLRLVRCNRDRESQLQLLYKAIQTAHRFDGEERLQLGVSLLGNILSRREHNEILAAMYERTHRSDPPISDFCVRYLVRQAITPFRPGHYERDEYSQLAHRIGRSGESNTWQLGEHVAGDLIDTRITTERILQTVDISELVYPITGVQS